MTDKYTAEQYEQVADAILDVWNAEQVQNMLRQAVQMMRGREALKVTDADVHEAVEAYVISDKAVEVPRFEAMRAALESFIASRAAVPDGWKLVPIDATSAMQSAGGHVNSEWLNDNAPIGESRYGGPVMRSVWKAMLAAAPEVTK